MNEESLKLLIKSWEERVIDARVKGKDHDPFGAKFASYGSEANTYARCVDDLRAVLRGCEIGPRAD